MPGRINKGAVQLKQCVFLRHYPSSSTLFGLGMMKLVVSFLLVFACCFSRAETEELVIGKQEAIHSKILNETRKLLVSLPDGYEDSGYSYPVLYFSDGTAHFESMVSTVNFLSKNSLIPPLIVVGIDTSPSRTRDLTPSISNAELAKPSWYSKQNPGGADQFLDFMSQELFPYINKEYRTADFNVFSGHSLGGLFSIHTYLTQPHLFDGYIAVSPSLWWDNERLVADAKDLYEQNKLTNKFLFLSKGNEQGPMDSAYQSMVELFEKHNSEKVFSQAFPEESHLTVVFNAHYKGLKSIFSDWSLPFKESAKGLDVVKAHKEKVKNIFKVNFTSVGWLINLGNSERYKKNYDAAIAAFQYNISLFPDYPYSYFLLAKTLEDKEQPTLALKYYEQANELVPVDSPYKKLYEAPIEALR